MADFGAEIVGIFGITRYESSGKLPRPAGNKTDCNRPGRRATSFRDTMTFAVKPIPVANALAFLLVLLPLMHGQNADEFLVFRLPARNGYINQPGAPPFPPLQVQRFASSGTLNCGNKAGCGSVCNSIWPNLAMGKCKPGRQVGARARHCAISARDLVAGSSHGNSPGTEDKRLPRQGGH